MPVSTERLSLVYHHCHGVVPTDLDRPAFEDLITESPWAAAAGASFFDTQLGFAIRRWCGPLLNLDPSVPADEYLCRRSELGATEVNKRLLRASGITDYVIDTGHQRDAILDPAGMADAGAAEAWTVARLEAVIAESLELTPFHKSLFSSDAFDISELYLTGAVLFRRGLGRVLDEWVREGDWSTEDADRVAEMIAAATARRVYRLDGR